MYFELGLRENSLQCDQGTRIVLLIGWNSKEDFLQLRIGCFFEVLFRTAVLFTGSSS